MRLLATVVVVVVAASVAACAEVGRECVGSVLQVTAQACVDVICDDDRGDVVDPAKEKAPDRSSEVPAPEWAPHEGNCDVSTGDDGSVRVACPDGTRAQFLAGGDARVLEERDEAVGADVPCTSGHVVRQGIDVDGDGALEPTEITGRTFDCPDKDGVRAQTLVGHLAIYGPDDVARLAGRRALSGGLVVKSAGLVRLELPQLQSVGGTVRVEGAPSLETIALPHLAAIAGDLVVARTTRLAAVLVPVLRRVGGSVIVVDNPRLPEADVEAVIFRLSEHGFAGPVDLAGNAVRGKGDAPPAP